MRALPLLLALAACGRDDAVLTEALAPGADPGISTWTNRTVPSPSPGSNPNPPGRTGAALAFDTSGKGVLYGGWNGVDSNSTRDDTWEWDGAAKTWTAIAIDPADRPPALHDHTLAFFGDAFVLVGGQQDDGMTSNAKSYAYDLTQKKWTALSGA